MYEIPIIDWQGIAEYLKPLLSNMGEFKSIVVDTTSTELHYEKCSFLLYYDVQDRYLSINLLVKSTEAKNKYIILINPIFDYYLNGNFKNYIDNLNKNNYTYTFSEGKAIILDYMIAIINSKGFETYINKGFNNVDYEAWVKENSSKINPELLRIYNENR